jgi:HEAT repeat protein
LIKAATLPRPFGLAETEALLVRIWNREAFDIPIANDPVFRLSVASALSRLDAQQCVGCSEYARGLLSAAEMDVRSAAALEMGELGSAEDIQRLRQMIRLDDFRVAQGAAAALSGIAEGDSIPILRELMSDPGVSAEKRALLAEVIEGVEQRQAILERLRPQ